MLFIPHDYQAYSIKWILDNPKSGLFLEMGLGKTSCTLTALNDLLFDYFDIGKVLVIAPKRVAESTWSDEIEKWNHVKDLQVSVVAGTEKQRIAALEARADIYTLGRDNVVWLVEYLQANKIKWPFDALVIDELSSFKNTKSKRFKALKKITPLLNHVIGLTGTPTPNSLIELWPQMYLLDRGERLGKTQGAYKDRYFYPVSGQGHVVYKYGLKEGAEKAIYEAIGDICVSMKSEDHLKMPERIDNFIELKLPANVMRAYKEFEKEKILEFKDDVLTAANAAVVAGKLLQFANGYVYDDEKKSHFVHNVKIEALKEIIDTSQEQSVLVFYNFKHDYEALAKEFKALKPRTIETPQDIKDWNAGKIQLLLAHPASIGHGLNIQAGGHIIVWYGLTWSLELYQQANARLYRQGQKESVIIHHLVAQGTMDEQVIKILKEKDKGQNALMSAVKARIKQHERG
ncbi:SNF2-related protein [Cellulosilyticum sp. WCF-2]|uniref:SNF2-related protein n=1 Tax=Cellulosilyticum sp. WCF-2 TaxID=2497860 RepID=UPI000F8F1DC5|nr:SNF2-related protein [Cellulosilyticum sp. WCF-2]QEH69733.1 DEAD/DEAH box helicase [Cellulosilyticum sp. WCF-2]